MKMATANIDKVDFATLNPNLEIPTARHGLFGQSRPRDPKGSTSLPVVDPLHLAMAGQRPKSRGGKYEFG